MSMQEAFSKAGFKGGGSPSEKGQVQQVPPKITFRTGGQLKREVLTTDAKNWADWLYNEGNGVTATQLRNFFNEVKALQSRIEAGGFEANDAIVGLLKSKVAYAYARAEKKKKNGFKYLQSMIEQGVDYSDSKDKFNDFAIFFEAVMGFYKGGEK